MPQLKTYSLKLIIRFRESLNWLFSDSSSRVRPTRKGRRRAPTGCRCSESPSASNWRNREIEERGREEGEGGKGERRERRGEKTREREEEEKDIEDLVD